MQQQIGLMLLPDEEFRLRVIHGVVDYIRREPSLRLTTVGGVPYLPWEELSSFRGDGLIAVAHTRRTVRRLSRMRCPVVNVSSQSQQDELPSVAGDDASVGRIAAKHLLERRCEHAVCIYYPRWSNDTARLMAFLDEVERAGIPATTLAVSFKKPVRHLETERPQVDAQKLASTLNKLPRPLSIFATHDEFAAASVEALRSLGASLPYDAAILGVANNRLICESCDPPLSSVAQPGEQIGFEAASALHRLLRGE